MTRTKNLRTRSVLSLSALALLITAGLLYAGPLNPPPGPIAGTGKTLTEIEPRIAINATNTPGDADSLFKITQPGSYYLTGSIIGVAGKHGIEIAASGVTVDLNGFDLAGVAGTGAFHGVRTTAVAISNIAVINGSIRTWSGDGLDIGSLTSVNCRVENLLASRNGGAGVRVGAGSTITNCSAYANIGDGIIAQSGSTITNCSAYANTGDGIIAQFGCTIMHCSVHTNTGTGIGAGAGNTITNCSAYGNTRDGVSVGAGNTVTNCSVHDNSENGINASSGCNIAGCAVRLNTLDGIRCGSDSVIRANICASNGDGGDGASIHATGNDNRIEGNNCAQADRGIAVDGSGNIILSNTCTGSTTDWVIAANNVVGPILDRRGAASAAINGFSFPGSLGTTDPHANFSY